MKELSIEQKAQRYDEAIEKFNVILNLNTVKKSGTIFADDVRKIFPELKESEDEQHRKWIIEYLYDGLRRSDEQFKDHFKAAIAWLEKQGVKVSVIEGFETEFERQVSALIVSAINKEHEYNQGYVKWTANALLSYAKRELEKRGEQKPVEWSQEDLICLGYLADFVDKNGDDFYGKNKPNVVKWIRSFVELPTHISINEIEQKPAKWSDEDEKIYQSIMDDTVQENQLNSNQTNWLRDIKYRYFPQPKQEWGEEDEEQLDRALYMMEQLDMTKSWDDVYNWLKSLKQRYTWKPSDEQIKALEHFVRSVGESGYASPYNNNTKLLYSLLFDLKKLTE